VSDAVERGARCAPVVIVLTIERLVSSTDCRHGVDHSMKLMRDETFGPVLPIMTFKTDEEAVRLANDSIYGLTASVFTRESRARKAIAEQIDAGTVMVNEVVYTHAVAQTPWGGVKQSGYGRTHGSLGLLELVSAQHIHVNAMPGLRMCGGFRIKARRRAFPRLARRFTTGSVLDSISAAYRKSLRRLIGTPRNRGAPDISFFTTTQIVVYCPPPKLTSRSAVVVIAI
jgi:hypothetical protein